MQIEPDADRLGGIVLKQHRDFSQAALRQRLGERAGHHHVARLVDLAEQAGVAFTLPSRVRDAESDEIGACMGIPANGAWVGRLGDVRNERVTSPYGARSSAARALRARDLATGFTGALC
jgi:hypothetical protein